MDRDTGYQFLSTDAAEMTGELIADYEAYSGQSLSPASPEMLLLRWFASALLLERARFDRAANRNIPSRAEGEDLDALAELFYARAREEAKAAVCTIRFTICAPQAEAVEIPAGTRVTDRRQTLYWQTEEAAWVRPGETWAEAAARCQSAGTEGNGWLPGQIDTLVDLFDWYAGCENVTESAGGADRMTDEELYEAMRMSMDALSTAGARGSYVYHAKAVSTQIGDVEVGSPAPGEVRIYAMMRDGRPAGGEMKQAILAACGADDVRPLTDHVLVEDPEMVEYDVELTYYLPAGGTGAVEVRAAVEEAVERYVQWQGGKLGRDINPSKLVSMVMETGVKRVDLKAPEFVRLRSGTQAQAPQVAALRCRTVVDGGEEDE